MEKLLDEHQLEQIVEYLARQIAADQAHGQPLMIVGLLKGCLPFMADLCRSLSGLGVLVEMEYLRVESYLGRRSSGVVRIFELPEVDIVGREILLVDDILDTGLTLREVARFFRERGVGRVSTCVLLCKEGRDATAVDYLGLTIPDVFVVGYGMDDAGQYRELPYVGIVSQDEPDAACP
jgi:hypoxanthine phosphoribosyltransferase